MRRCSARVVARELGRLLALPLALSAQMSAATRVPAEETPPLPDDVFDAEDADGDGDGGGQGGEGYDGVDPIESSVGAEGSSFGGAQMWDTASDGEAADVVAPNAEDPRPAILETNADDSDARASVVDGFSVDELDDGPGLIGGTDDIVDGLDDADEAEFRRVVPPRAVSSTPDADAGGDIDDLEHGIVGTSYQGGRAAQAQRRNR